MCLLLRCEAGIKASSDLGLVLGEIYISATRFREESTLFLLATGVQVCLANGIVYPSTGDTLVAGQHHNVTWCVSSIFALQQGDSFPPQVDCRRLDSGSHRQPHGL